MNMSGSTLSNTPEVVALINLGANFPPALYAGTALAIQVHAGTQSLFSALAGSENVTGE
jgi:hypothetical protein